LRIVCELGQKVGLPVWPDALRHSSRTQAAELGQEAGLGLDKIRAFSRHRTITTLMMYVDEHDRQNTQKTLGDLVANTLTLPWTPSGLVVPATRRASRRGAQLATASSASTIL
jgi:hypothetical protein